jgi:hypothetical protein
MQGKNFASYLIMKRSLLFYLIIILLVLMDSLLLSSPNLLGKIGLFIYKYQYLRSFPRTLLTVSLIIIIATAIAESIRLLVRSNFIRRGVGFTVLFILVVGSIAILIKTGLDFSKWTYGHTGQRFKYGAYLLPVLLILVFGYRLITLPNQIESPSNANQKFDVNN